MTKNLLKKAAIYSSILMNASTSRVYNKKVIDELLLTRLKSLFDSNLLTEETYTNYKQKIGSINTLKFNHRKISNLPLGLILYLYFKSKNIFVSDEVQFPYHPSKTLSDVIKTVDQIAKLVEIGNQNHVQTIFAEHYSQYEKNTDYLINIKDNYEHLLTSMNFKESFEQILSQLAEGKQTKQQTIKIDEQLEEKLLNLIEDYFKHFKDKKVENLPHIDWPETLIDRARKIYFSSMVSSDAEATTSLIEKHERESNEQRLLNIATDDRDTTKNQLAELVVQPAPILTPNTSRRINGSILNAKNNYQIDPWDLVGKILAKKNSEEEILGLGIIELPMKDTAGKIYITVKVEKEVEVDQVDSLFRDIQNLRIAGISDTTQLRLQSLAEVISEYLGYPKNICLFPTLIWEYLAKREIHSEVQLKTTILRKEYYPMDKISLNEEYDELVFVDETISPRYHLSGIESLPGKPFEEQIAIKKRKISLNNNVNIGQVYNQIFYQNRAFLLVEYDFPSMTFINDFIPKIKGFNAQNTDEMWYLRFFISKKIDVFEAEALSYWNLWKYIFQEKIPILPFDLRLAYLGIVPTQSIKFSANNEKIFLKRGQEPLPLYDGNGPSSLTSITAKESIIGALVGITLNEKSQEPVLLYSNLTPAELFRKLGRETTDLSKLETRIQIAFNVKKEEALRPRTIITYLTFFSAHFATYIDLSDFNTVEQWLINTFSLKQVFFRQVISWNQEKHIITIKEA